VQVSDEVTGFRSWICGCRTNEAAASAQVQAAQPGGPAPAPPLEVLTDDDGAVPHCNACIHTF